MKPAIGIPFVLEDGVWREDNVALTSSNDLTTIDLIEDITDPEKVTVEYNGAKIEVTIHARDGYGWVREEDLE